MVYYKKNKNRGMFMMNDVIVALATAPMESAIAVIRVSGEDSFGLLKKIFSKKINVEGHKAYFGNIVDDGNIIEHPHWFELAKQKWNHIYKTTGTPCSCCICKGERYNRRDFKKDTQRIIRESLE